MCGVCDAVIGFEKVLILFIEGSLPPTRGEVPVFELYLLVISRVAIFCTCLNAFCVGDIIRINFARFGSWGSVYC